MLSRTMVLKLELQNSLPGSPELHTVGSGWCLNACTIGNSQVVLKLIVWGPHFENHYSETALSYQMPTKTGEVMSVSDP